MDQLLPELLLVIFNDAVHTDTSYHGLDKPMIKPSLPRTTNVLRRRGSWPHRADVPPPQRDDQLVTDINFPDTILRLGVTTHAINSCTPLTLSHVCKTWRDVAISATELWSTIYVTNGSCGSQNLLQTYLTNSASQPLDLVFRDTINQEKDGSTMMEMIRLVSKHHERWRSLKIRLRTISLSMGQIKEVFAATSTPNLEVLAFSFNITEPLALGDDPFTPVWTDLIRTSPRLKEMQIWDTMDESPEFLDALPYSRLTTLTLPMVFVRAVCPMLLDISRQCRVLTTLSISLDSSLEGWGYGPVHPLQSNEHPILIQTLRDLHLTDVTPTQRLPALLSQFQLPSLLNLTIHIRSGDDSDFGTDKTLRVLDRMLTSSQCKLRSLAFRDEVTDGQFASQFRPLLTHPALEDLSELRIGSVVDEGMIQMLTVTNGSRSLLGHAAVGTDSGEGNTSIGSIDRISLPNLQHAHFDYLGFSSAMAHKCLTNLVLSRTGAVDPVHLTSPFSTTRVARLLFVKAGFLDAWGPESARKSWDARNGEIQSGGPAVERLFFHVGEDRSVGKEHMYRDFSMVQGWRGDI